MIDFAMMETIRNAANVVQHNIWITKGAKETFGVDGEPEWHNRFSNEHLSFASLAQSEKTLLALMDENQNAVMADCQDRHDNGLDLFPQLKTLIDRLVAVQWTIAQCGSYSIYKEINQERPSFIFPDPTTDQVISQIRRWLGWFDYYFPGCLSDYKTNCKIPGMEAYYFPGCMIGQCDGQNGGHTEPTRDNNDKSTDRGVNGRETASNDAIPEWLPECIPAEDYKTQQNIDGNRWFGTLVELVLWLEPFVYNGTTHRWKLVDCLFEYRGKGGEWKPATRTDLASAFDKVKNSNRYELQ